MVETTRVLGIDPGLARTGYGIVEQRGARLVALHFGSVKTSAKIPLPERLHEIYQTLAEVIAEARPMAASIEDVFHQKNFQSAVKIAYVRATAMIACNLAGIPVFTYSPRAMKKSVVGYGNAEKTQIQSMVRMLLQLREPPRPFDAADALALAICHINTIPLRASLEVNS